MVTGVLNDSTSLGTKKKRNNVLRATSSKASKKFQITACTTPKNTSRNSKYKLLPLATENKLQANCNPQESKKDKLEKIIIAPRCLLPIFKQLIKQDASGMRCILTQQYKNYTNSSPYSGNSEKKFWP